MRWISGKPKARRAPRRALAPRGLRLEVLEERIALTTLPAGFAETTVSGGLTAPTSMAIAPDGRIFVTEQAGNVRVIKDGVLQATPFLTLSVSSSGERGLLGLAFDPNFASNSFVYVYYTTSGAPIHNRVSRFTANGDVVVPGSEVQLLNLNNLSATNHNGGALHFGIDGKLYVAVGENAVGSNSQTLNNLLGKMLRINSDGTIPTDNPFFNTASGENRAIWALGLRNPFTFAVQPGSGRIFINDVGQSTWEEINDGLPGANYGWPTTEGPTTNPSFTSPLFSYPNGEGVNEGCAIAGGAFYNPFTRTFPTDYTGDYFFADLCGLFIRRYDPASGVVSDFASGTPFGTVDVDVAADGSLLYLSRGTNAVMRIQSTAVPGPTVVVAAGGGAPPLVRVLDAATGMERSAFAPYVAGFGGGVRVATGDVNADGVRDIITAPGPGGSPHVRVFNGATGQVIREFNAYNVAFAGGVFVATGDFNADGRADIVTAPGAGGGPHVRVFSGVDGAVLGEFFAYDGLFTGGVQVAVGDVDGTGGLDIITGAGPGGGPHVRVFRNVQGAPNVTIPGRYAYDPNFSGGVFVAAGDVTGDGRAEIITGPGAGGGPHVRVFGQALQVVSEFFAYSPNFTGGVRVGLMDLSGDQHLELITAAGPGGGPHVRIWSIPSVTELAGFFAFGGPNSASGVFVAGTRNSGLAGISALAAPETDDRPPFSGPLPPRTWTPAPGFATPSLVDHVVGEMEDEDTDEFETLDETLDALACALCMQVG